MKRLTLIRHATSHPSAETGSDHDRSLTERGLEEATQMAAVLADQSAPPQLILSSSAKRALTTAHIFAEALAYPQQEIELLPELYSAYNTTLINLIQSQDDDIQHIALIGHNPAISEFSQYLSGKRTGMSPATVIQLQLSITQWCELAENCATIQREQRPSLAQLG